MNKKESALKKEEKKKAKMARKTQKETKKNKKNSGKKARISLLGKIKIGPRLIIAFLIVALIAGAIGFVGMNGISQIEELDKEMYDTMTVPLTQMLTVVEAYQRIRGDLKDVVMAENENDRARFADNAMRNSVQFNVYLDMYEKTLFSEEGKRLLPEVRDSFAEYMEVANDIILLANEGKRGEAINLMNNSGEFIRTNMDAKIRRMVQIKNDAAAATVASNSETAAATRAQVLSLLFAGMLISVLLGIGIALSITRPCKKALTMMKNMSNGNLTLRVNSRNKDEIGQMTKAMDNFADILQNSVVHNMQRISEGDVSMEIEAVDEMDEITPALQTMIKAIRELVKDANMLSESAIAGDLSVRADVSKHGGDFAKVVEGVNATLDAVVTPLDSASAFIEQLAQGNVSALMENNYQGYYYQFVDNINKVVNSLLTMLDQMNQLSQSAIEGDLTKRADVSELQGGYAKIVSGVNDTLDAVIEPVTEATTVLEEMSKGNLKLRVNGDYKGDHSIIKQALNKTLDEVSGYIDEISFVLTEMSNSNFDVVIERDYMGDFVNIKDALNLIINTFNEVLYEINESANQVSAGSRQVSEGSQSLSQGTTEQASSIQELTATMTEIASQTKQNASSASEANQLAVQAKGNAEQGNEQMKQMVKAMEEISDSSNNISKIIKVIDDIAFQTNILALNAAVEAARAGQHGKGFAVVAEEVRNLAARSAEAAKETTEMIETSIRKVGDGTEIADRTAQALQKIVEDISRSSDLVNDIALASNEQASGIAQINEGVTQVSKVVQANSATSEESAAASEELSSQAQMLKERISRFNLRLNN